MLGAPRFSGSSLVWNILDFPDEPGVHVENKTTHRNFFGYPGMRSHLLDLFARVLFRVLVREQAHRSGRRIASQSCEFRVQLSVGECGEAAAGVIQQHDLRRSEDARGNYKLPEHVFGYRRPAGTDHVKVSLRQSKNMR